MKSKYIILLPFFFVGFFFYSCRSEYTSWDNKHYNKQTIPGTVKVNNKLLIDKSEITNFNWCEYLYWIKRVYGEHTFEYMEAMPHTECWDFIATSYPSYGKFYLFHPAYQNFPVVGITQMQAEIYTGWRSDRVFENILISSGIIQQDTAPQPETHFTIERYFTGKYKGINPDTNHLFYPVYSLPSKENWIAAVRFEDSVYYHKSKSKPERNFNADYVPVRFPETFSDPTMLVNAQEGKYNPKIYNLRGNVSEWTNRPDTTIGGGWYNSKVEILYDTVFRCDTANAWTGFRNVACWKKWENVGN